MRILIIHRTDALLSQITASVMGWYANELKALGHEPRTVLDYMTATGPNLLDERAVLRAALVAVADADEVMTVDLLGGSDMDSRVVHMARVALIPIVPAENMVRNVFNVAA